MGIYDLGLCFLSHFAPHLVFGDYKYGHAQKYALASAPIFRLIHPCGRIVLKYGVIRMSSTAWNLGNGLNGWIGLGEPRPLKGVRYRANGNRIGAGSASTPNFQDS